MDPTATELAAVGSLPDLWAWMGAEDAFIAAWHGALGDPQLIWQIVSIPRSIYDAAAPGCIITMPVLP
eukprot:11273013-Heterocapsa_arctica.AAC.1